MNGHERISAERVRQIEIEGWTPDHDKVHSNGELIDAAIAYALAANHMKITGKLHWWPWGDEFWKPSEDKIRNLEKAGALIAAEIDRLQQ